MKKLMLLAASGLMIVGMTACKKDYTCDCTLKYTNTVSDPNYQSSTMADYTETSQFKSKLKKKESEEWCSAYESTASSSVTETLWELDANGAVVYDPITFQPNEKEVTFTQTSTSNCSLN